MYWINRIKVDVIRASQIQKVPQVGLPQIDPVTNTNPVQIRPIVMAEFKKIAEIFVLQTKNMKPFTAKNK
tara:strand:+ start:53 stop:262 length:210 start_codon:yes stop_codon:yes gene_type:complete